MKQRKMKVVAILLTLVLTLALLAPLGAISASAAGEASAVGDYFNADGLKYEILTLPRMSADEPPRLLNGTVRLVRPLVDETEYPENTDLVLPPTVTNEKGESFIISEIADGAFEGYENIRSVDMSETGIKSIGDNAFSNCKDLETVKFSESVVEEIGEYAFYGCNLSVVYLESYVFYSVGRYAFANNENLKYAVIVGWMESGTTAGDNIFFGVATGFKLYTNDLTMKSYFESQVTVEDTEMVYDGLGKFRETHVHTGDEFVYTGQPIETPEVWVRYETISSDNSVRINGLSEGAYSVSYYREGRLTEDFTSAGVIDIVVTFDPHSSSNTNHYSGSLTLKVTILPAELTVIARDKSVADGQSAAGTANDVLCYGLNAGDILSAVTLSASGSTLSPSQAVVKNAAGVDVTENYRIIYANGRAFADLDKSVTGVTKGEDGNYTLSFGDGSGFVLEIPKAVSASADDGADDDADGKQDGEKDGNGADSVLTYVAIGLGGAALLLGLVSLILGLTRKKVPVASASAPASEPESDSKKEPDSE